MQDIENRLRELSDRVNEQMPSELHPTPRARRRIRVSRAVRSGAVLATIATLAVGGFAASDLLKERSVLQPAERNDQDVPPPAPMRNGRILHSGDGTEWRKDTAPPPPDDESYYAWDAYDQDTGSFLHVSESGLNFVVNQEGLIAEFPCDPAADCGLMDTFGPGPDEVTAPAENLTVPAEEPGLRRVQIMGFDGAVRDTLDVSAIVTQDQVLADLAWSPDGSRLAISTEHMPGCDSNPCEGNVWIFDRDGGEPQLVYTESAPDDLVEGQYVNTPVLTNLAWSPDGQSLGLLAGGIFGDDGVTTRLVALRLPPGQQVRVDTLHVYDDNKDWPKNHGSLATNDDDLHFNFAWSPDGSRIAVNNRGGIAEISAENGTILVRHSGKDLHAPLAWLPKR
jgi:WD40 repeat protein